MRVLRRLSALRHGRGFGVHSPLAYEVITSVLPDRPAYYADADIASLTDNKRRRRIFRIVLRLMVRFGPKTVFCESLFQRVALSASKNICFIDAETDADMAIVRSNGKTDIRIGHPAEGRGPLILDNDSDLRITIFRRGLSPTLIYTTL